MWLVALSGVISVAVRYLKDWTSDKILKMESGLNNDVLVEGVIS